MEAGEKARHRIPQRVAELGALAAHDWDFTNSDTGYQTHGLHPYPAKFIPQIPRAIISALSRPGDTVADIFCGSGTTLVEALLNGRHAIGVDANPLACLISEAKTARLSSGDVSALVTLANQLSNALPWLSHAQDGLFTEGPELPKPLIPDSDAVRFWFDPIVARELGVIRAMLETLPPGATSLAKAVYSSIIVTVSKQDSDTRYVRRQKNIAAGDTVRRFVRALQVASKAATDFSKAVDDSLTSRVICADILSGPDTGPIDLVVSSPPYPNAYSYHLYHMTRMVWLGLDQPTFKKQEIGSHRKYSHKGPNGATVATFRSELETVFTWLYGCLKPRGYACFVVGDSTLKGTVIHNDELLVDVATERGFVLRENFSRRLQDTRKAFNPKIGKIKDEHVVILQRAVSES